MIVVNAIRYMLLIPILSVGLTLTYVTIREWVRNGFKLLPDEETFISETFEENK